MECGPAWAPARALSTCSIPGPRKPPGLLRREQPRTAAQAPGHTCHCIESPTPSLAPPCVRHMVDRGHLGMRKGQSPRRASQSEGRHDLQRPSDTSHEAWLTTASGSPPEAGSRPNPTRRSADAETRAHAAFAVRVRGAAGGSGAWPRPSTRACCPPEPRSLTAATH